MKKTRISITLDTEIAELIERTRGRIPRSTFINEHMSNTLRRSVQGRNPL